MSRSETKLDWRSLPHAFQILLARRTLGLATKEHLVLAAHAILDFGIYTPSLVDLIAREVIDNTSEAVKVFDLALYELNLRPMANEEAIACWYEGRFSDASESDDYFSLPRDELASHDWIGFSTIRSNDMLTRLDLAWHFVIMDRVYIGQDNDVLRLRRRNLRGIENAKQWMNNRFKPRCDPSWPTWNSGTIPHLATRIQKERAFEMLPILADALEEAGCIDRAMLDHCRAGKPHTKYCWVAALFAAKG